MHTPASANFLGDTSDIVTINVVLKGGRTGGCNRPLWSLCVCPTLCTCALVPCTWWTAAAHQPATQRAAWHLAAFGAAVRAGSEPRARLRLLLLRCRRAGWLPLHCMVHATRIHAEIFGKTCITICAVVTAACEYLVMFWWRDRLGLLSCFLLCCSWLRCCLLCCSCLRCWLLCCYYLSGRHDQDNNEASCMHVWARL